MHVVMIMMAMMQVNTLKYANRAKEIKTFVRRNTGTVNAHISEYQRMIDALQEEVSDLKQALQQQTGAPVKRSNSERQASKQCFFLYLP